MSILIDDLVRVYSPVGQPSFIRVKDRHYIAKPDTYKGPRVILNRVRDAFRVLFGKSYAYHYWEDTN